MFKFILSVAVSISLLCVTLVDQVFCTAPVVDAQADDSFLHIKNRIDSCVDNNRSDVIRTQMQDMLKFTLKSINKDDPCVRLAMIKLGMTEGESSGDNLDYNHRERYLTILGSFFLINESMAQDVVSGYDVLLTAQASATLLEYFIPVTEAGRRYTDYLTESVFKIKARMHSFGQKAELMLNCGKVSYRMKTYMGQNRYQYAYRAGEAPDLKRMSRDNARSFSILEKNLYLEYPSVSATLVPNCFMPLALCGDDALFTEKGFLYALSRGVFPLGIFDRPLAGAHGGVWSMPLAALLHDLGHGNDMLIKEEGFVSMVKQLARSFSAPLMSKLYVDLDKIIYNLLDDESVFTAQEKPKAIRAAFYMFHESIPNCQFYELLDAHKWIPSDATIEALFMNETETWDSAVQKLNKKPIVAGDLLKVIHIQTKGFVWERLSHIGPMERKVACDIPRDVLEIQDPENKEAIELQLYGQDNPDRTLHYDAQLAENLMNELLDWFYDKIKDHESVKAFLPTTVKD